LLSPARYIHKGDELFERGLYLDMHPYCYHVFILEVNP
jgi:hypothetical protein